MALNLILVITKKQLKTDRKRKMKKQGFIWYEMTT